MQRAEEVCASRPPRSLADRADAPLADAEDGAQDHFEGDLLHARMDREGLAEAPGVDLAIDDLLDHRLIGAHPFAVEGGQHQLAARQCSAPSRSRIEREPMTGSRVAFRPGGSPFSGVSSRSPSWRPGSSDLERRLEAEEGDPEGLAVALAAFSMKSIGRNIQRINWTGRLGFAG